MTLWKADYPLLNHIYGLGLAEGCFWYIMKLYNCRADFQSLQKGQKAMFLFGKKKKEVKKEVTLYDKSLYTPVLRCSICTGEQVAGFKDKQTGKFTDVMLIRGEDDLQAFKEQYCVDEIVKEY